MVTKGEATREMILEKAALLFNRKGYFGASMSDIMEATGLEKGGIYNYFSSKDDLALQAFDYSVDLMREQYAQAIRGQSNAIDRLKAVMAIFVRLTEEDEGGCPVMNTAITADDAHPALRQRALDAMQEWHDFIRRIVLRGIQRGEIRSEGNPDEVATVIYAMLEGAVVMTRLTHDPVHMQRIIDHLASYFETSLRV